jgi:hypothetical protein
LTKFTDRCHSKTHRGRIHILLQQSIGTAAGGILLSRHLWHSNKFHPTPKADSGASGGSRISPLIGPNIPFINYEHFLKKLQVICLDFHSFDRINSMKNRKKFEINYLKIRKNQEKFRDDFSTYSLFFWDF